MNIKSFEQGIIVEGLKHFDIGQILECGQCFRFYKNDEQDYTVVAFKKILRIKQENEKIFFYHTSKKLFKEIWTPYFGLGTDYGEIKEKLSHKDEVLNEAVLNKWGIRLLVQDTWETLISFIISQNKHITHIKRLIENLSEAYGDYIGEAMGKKIYTFPSPKQLSRASEQDLRNLKVGFRAPYIVDACEKVRSKEIDLDNLSSLTSIQAKEQLIKIKGVGSKVADCVLLYGLSKYDVFPTDVWVKRIMEYYYFKDGARIEEIHNFAKEQYGALAGYAQQYLFYYARDNKIGK